MSMLVRTRFEVILLDDWPNVKIIVTQDSGPVREDKKMFDIAAQGHFEPLVLDALRKGIQNIIRIHKPIKGA
jgi:hypothetical protein